MTAYYNEIDPYAAQWLRNLIAAGHIARGDVDERSIEDVRPNDLRGYTQCHFFAGIGVWSYALRQAGWPDDKPAWTGSCPCQPFSEAGKGLGFADKRHLWPAFQWLIAQRGPSIIFGEQASSKSVDPWIDLVHADLEALGYAFGCVPFPSAGIGAPHNRDRCYWVAHANDTQWGAKEPARNFRDRFAAEWDEGYGNPWQRLHDEDWKAFASDVLLFPDGDSTRNKRLRAYGNAINAKAAQVLIESVKEVSCA